jgi:hypothetical protein
MSDPTENRVSIDCVPGGCLIRVAGTIETNFDLSRFAKQTRGVVLIDLDQVRRINSYGVRQWSRAVRDLPATYLGFARCRPPMVMQFNITTNFAGRGHLMSMYLPFSCETCGHLSDRLMDVLEQSSAIKAFEPPEVTCASCGHPAVFDDIPRAYFSYVARVPPAAPPPLMRELMARLA